MPRNEFPWFVGAVVAGGIVGPVLLMLGLTGMPESGASLLLNAEGVFTALLAWFAFKENFDRRIALGEANSVVAPIHPQAMPVIHLPLSKISMSG
ncbi:MAG: EamA family transporter [Phyllobacterium sp.]|uniref:EamA family transporter n=1 Tax=Phyllobacterium sp. TaxID=1871046 RepID=UPI0030F04D08